MSSIIPVFFYLSIAAKSQKRNFSNISLGETFVFYHEATKGLVE